MKKHFLFGLTMACVAFCSAAFVNVAQTTETVSATETTERSFDMEEMLSPIWEGTTSYNESVTLIKEADGTIEPIKMLYPIKEIISVQNAELTQTFVEGRDYTVVNGKLVVYEDSPMATEQVPYGNDENGNILTDTRAISYETYHPVQGGNKWWGTGDFASRDGGYLLFAENNVFHQHQIVVTYTHEAGWDKYVPESKGALMGDTIAKLKSKDSLNMLVYGDSISTGANSSGGPFTYPQLYISPNMPIYPNMFAEGLQMQYPGSTINVINESVGGTDSAWAVNNLSNVTAKYSDIDLAIVAFGMNDVSVSPEAHAANIETIVNGLKTAYAASGIQILVVAPMLPNYDAVAVWGQQYKFYESLRKLEETGVVVVNVTALHKSILQEKRYVDITGNNINHTNDYTARMYAQALLKTMQEEVLYRADGNVQATTEIQPYVATGTWMGETISNFPAGRRISEEEWATVPAYRIYGTGDSHIQIATIGTRLFIRANVYDYSKTSLDRNEVSVIVKDTGEQISYGAGHYGERKTLADGSYSWTSWVSRPDGTDGTVNVNKVEYYDEFNMESNGSESVPYIRTVSLDLATYYAEGRTLLIEYKHTQGTTSWGDGALTERFYGELVLPTSTSAPTNVNRDIVVKNVTGNTAATNGVIDPTAEEWAAAATYDMVSNVSNADEQTDALTGTVHILTTQNKYLFIQTIITDPTISAATDGFYAELKSVSGRYSGFIRGNYTGAFIDNSADYFTGFGGVNPILSANATVNTESTGYMAMFGIDISKANITPGEQFIIRIKHANSDTWNAGSWDSVTSAAVYFEQTVTLDPTWILSTIKPIMAEGASIGFKGYTLEGINLRFRSLYKKQDAETLQRLIKEGTPIYNANGALTLYKEVEFGTLVLPLDYLTEGIVPTVESLTANNVTYLDVKSSGFYADTADGQTYYYGGVKNLKTKNYDRDFVGVGYIRLIDWSGNETYIYAEYNPAYARAGREIVTLALNDLADTANELYCYPVEVEGVVKYSQFNEKQRAVLQQFKDTQVVE